MNVPTIFSRLRQLPSRQKSRALDFRRLHFANWRVTTSMRSHGRHRAISLTRIRERAGTCLLILASGLTTPTAVSAVVRTRLTWVNGVGHNLEHMNLPTSVISKLFGGTKPEFCHNPTAMTTEQDYVGYLGDMAQAGSQKLGRITAEVDALVSHLKEALARVGETGRIVHICHSQGALITSLAAKRLDRSDLSRIEVIAFGGAAALRHTRETPFSRCVNYYSVNDPLLALVPSAERALRSGFMGADSRGLPSDEPEFVFLAPRGGDPITDHSLIGPTYLQALEWEGRRFRRLYQPVSHRAARIVSTRVAFASEAMAAAIKDFLLKAVIALVTLVRNWNSYVRKGIVWLMGPASVCIVMLIKIVHEIMSDAIRYWKGEERFETVQSGYSPGTEARQL